MQNLYGERIGMRIYIHIYVNRESVLVIIHSQHKSLNHFSIVSPIERNLRLGSVL